MEKANLEILARRAVSDPVFRSRLLVDPEAAVAEAGWDLTPDEMAALKHWHDNARNVTKIEELERSLAHLIASTRPGPR